MCYMGKKECRYNCRFLEKKKLQQRKDTRKGKMLNVKYLQDQNTEYAKKKPGKKNFKRRKIKPKKIEKFKLNIETYGK